ncbi:MAG: hypothetical protein HQL31_14010, partial [Planctomycetes bacterium]|nr:hypothetical protein [Planctomycetota bacterium]
VTGEPLLGSVEELNSLELDLSTGRLPLVLEAARQLAKSRPEADIRIPLSGPFSIACHLMGMENMICELFSAPETARKALLHLAQNQLKFGRAALREGFGISLFESSVTPPLLSPQLFGDCAAPALTLLCKELSGPDGVQLIIGGDTVHILDAICAASPTYIICPVETDQEHFMKRMEELDPERQIRVRVNMKPGVFLPTQRLAARAEAEGALDLARRREGSLIGALIPLDADPALTREVSDFIERSVP